MKKLILIGLLIFGLNTAQSETCKWTGAVNGDWDSPFNWENYKMPKNSDDVIIPVGAKNTCQISSKYNYYDKTKTVEANSVTIYGTLEIQNGILNANNITNEGNIISNVYRNEIKNAGYGGCEINCNNFQNNSNFSLDGGHAEINASNVTNTGQLSCNTVFATSFNCNNFKNESSGVVEINNDARITSSETFKNSGQVIINAGSYEDVTITTNDLINNQSGLIYNKDKGKVSLNANNFINAGTVAAKGNSDIIINGNNISHEEGKIKSGEKKGIRKNLDIPLGLEDIGNITISARDNIAFVLSAGVIADTLTIIFNKFDIISLSEDSLILANKIILKGVSNSILDVKRNLTNKFLCSFGDIIVSSDSISPSVEKLQQVSNGNLVINKSDLDYVSASIFPNIIVDKSGAIDSAAIPVFFRTTAAKSWNYTITSMRGWIKEKSGDFTNAKPLTFDSLIVSYSLPSNADTLPDIVTISLTETISGYKTSADIELYATPNITTDVYVPNAQTQFEIHPNPFSESTTINYELQTADRVKIDIFNSLGEKITTLVDEWQEAGRHNTVFGVGAIHELPLQSGMYYYRIQIGERVENGKLLLIN